MRRLLALLLLLTACRTVEQSPDWDQPSRIVVDKQTGEPVVVLGAPREEDPNAVERQVERGDDPALAAFLAKEERALLRDADRFCLHEYTDETGRGEVLTELRRSDDVSEPELRRAWRARVYRALSELSFNARPVPGGTETPEDTPSWLALEVLRNGDPRLMPKISSLVLLFDLKGKRAILVGQGPRRERRATPAECEALWQLAFGPSFEELREQGLERLRRGLASPRARADAAEALAEEGARAAELLPEARAALRADPDPQVWPGVLLFLRRLGPGAAPAVRELVAILERDWSADLAPALEILLRPADPEPLRENTGPPRLSEARQVELLCGAIEALGAIGPEASAARPALERLAGSGDAALAESARAALSKLE